jgi:hypothetical protein
LGRIIKSNSGGNQTERARKTRQIEKITRTTLINRTVESKKKIDLAIINEERVFIKSGNPSRVKSRPKCIIINQRSITNYI